MSTQLDPPGTVLPNGSSVLMILARSCATEPSFSSRMRLWLSVTSAPMNSSALSGKRLPIDVRAALRLELAGFRLSARTAFLDLFIPALLYDQLWQWMQASPSCRHVCCSQN